MNRKEVIVRELTTLCYIEKDNKYLMLHRVYKKNDANKEKWLGIGGHFEKNESPEDCLIREVYEETGLELETFSFRGIVTFVSDIYPCEYMHLYTATIDEQTDIESIGYCNEGVLKWVDKSDVYKLNLWAGDKVFFRLLETRKSFFSLKLVYKGEQLTGAVLDGQDLDLDNMLLE